MAVAVLAEHDERKEHSSHANSTYVMALPAASGTTSFARSVAKASVRMAATSPMEVDWAPQMS